MKRLAYLSTFALLGLAIMMTPSTANAICGNSIIGGQLDYNCGGYFCYVRSPGQADPASLQGSFWSVGFANGATGSGSDNGNYSDDAWMRPYAGAFYMSMDWGGSTDIDGCIDTDAPVADQRMGAAWTDTSADGSQSFFAVACVDRDTGAVGGAQFDFTFGNGNDAGGGNDINLVAMPQARIAGTTRNGDGSVTVSVAPPDFSAGFYTLGAECTIGNVIPEFEVWFQEVPEGTTAPSDRRAGWSLGNTCLAGGNCDVTLPQGTTDAYFAVAPGFGNGMTTNNADGPVIGPNSVRVATNPNVADPVNIKVIRKGDIDKLKQRRR